MTVALKGLKTEQLLGFTFAWQYEIEFWFELESYRDRLIQSIITIIAVI